eukprot:TRINITY_DN941_c0_g1_i2.p1 TRINITY_DN941_c0_g1~~TRINITY_DN941_c0_g1_i2.p1  ORF type:complete len:301 (+),score=80.41 TRINITY_DN941_c0_g1_i2:356-1258(+)
MKILQKRGGFSKEELMSYKYIVYGNCVTQMKVLVNAAQKLNVTFSSPENEKRAQRLANAPPGGDSWSIELAEDIKALWEDPAIQKTYEMRDSHYQLNDSAQYFFDNISRFMDPNYVPSHADVLRARVRSTGIEEAEFTIDDLSFRMCDVGGQRSERRKWIHCFDGVTAVIFCVSLSEYDQKLREDDTQNRMTESLLLFDEVCNSKYFRNTNFILFLNKTDLFKEKIARVDLSVAFPSYTGGSNVDGALNFIKGRFLELNQTSKVIYTHFTCAIDTENVQVVFKACRDILLKRVLNDVVMY